MVLSYNLHDPASAATYRRRWKPTGPERRTGRKRIRPVKDTEHHH